MVEKQLLKLSKAHQIGHQFTIKGTKSGLINDSLVVTLYHLSNESEWKDVKKRKLAQANPSLLYVSVYDLREAKEVNHREVYWPYSIKDVDINAANQSILILSESLVDSTSQESTEKTLLFQVTLKLMLAPEDGGSDAGAPENVDNLSTISSALSGKGTKEESESSRFKSVS